MSEDGTPYKIPSNESFRVDSDELSWLAAERTTLLVAGTDSPGWHLLCQVAYSRKLGSIFVQFPYFSESKGIIADAIFEAAEGGKGSKIRLEERGRATSHHVKYHHPPDGNAHFSQDGKVRSEVRRSSFPLTTSGLIWEAHVFQPEGFELLSKQRIRSKRAYLPCYFDGPLPNALTISGTWRTHGEVVDRLVGEERGPFCTIAHGPHDQPAKVLLVGPPRGHRFSDRLLVINIGKADEVRTDEPTLIFLGGWDSPERANVRPGSGCLAFMYPSGDHDSLMSKIGTVDLNDLNE